jgi:membrane protease subunit HflC
MKSDSEDSTAHAITTVAKTWVVRVGASLVALAAVNSAIFSIDQTELGNVRRFGTVLYPKDRPLEPGVHFKIPLIDTADKLQVSLQTLHIPAFDVLTVDNQKVTIDENFNYTIPKEQVYHLLYEVGGSGNVDIKEQVIPVTKDRTARILAAQNMVTVNQNREAIQTQIERNVTKAVEELFGIKAHSLQIASIKPSAAFMASIDAATQAKNSAIKAENELRTRQFEAQQVAATAKGAADAAIENARGAAEATRLSAEAEKTRLVLTGEGQQASLTAQIKPFGNVDKYIEYLRAQAALKWNGQQPQIVTGNGAGTTLVVPVPSLGIYKESPKPITGEP